MSEPRDAFARPEGDGPPAGVEPTAPAADAALPRAAGQSAETELRTFLIADIRGYTTYTREQGDAAGAALAARFAELVAEVVGARDGFLLELRGDEALVVFVSARRALRAAIDLQARFVEAQLPRGVGIGLDAGEAIPVGDGYRGTALNLAARLCAQAGPGEILASEAVIHLAAKVDGIAYVDARSLRLKGYQEAVRAVAVVPSDRTKGHRLVASRTNPVRDRRVYAGVGVAIVVVALLAGVLGGGLLGRTGPSPAASANAAGDASSTGGPGSSTGPAPTIDPLGGAELPVLAFFDAESGHLNSTTPIKSPTNISFYSNGSFWSLGASPPAMNRMDPDTHAIVQSIPIPALEARAYTIDANSVWLTDGGGPQVIRIDQRSGVSTTFPLGADATDTEPGQDIATGAGSIWVSRLGEHPEIVRLDPETGKVQARIPDVTAGTLNFGGEALWYALDGSVGRIDPATNAPSFVPVTVAQDANLGNVAFAGGDAWVADSGSGRVWRIDRSGRSSSVTLPPGVGELASTGDTIWATNSRSGQMTGIDLVTGATGRTIDTGHATASVTAGGGEIMVAVVPTIAESVAQLQGTVLTIATSGAPWTDPSPDPAMNWTDQAQQALYLTCVGLVNYPDKPVPEGWTLQPEAAAAMPTISPDGRTYTFTVKPGFAFSPPSNEAVTAETFRATFERALSPILDDGAAGPTFLGDIVGVGDYRAGKTHHVAGLTVAGDQLSITLVAPAPDLLDRLGLPFFCPVPARTPVLRSGYDPDPPVSGAGPYYLAAAGRHSYITPRLIVLKKNPNYHGTRPQPFDNIAIQTQSATAVSIGRVRTGDLDATMLAGGETISSGTGPIATEWGPGSPHAAGGDQRWFGAPIAGTHFLMLNTARPTFRDADVRRAVALALDRAALGAIQVVTPSGALLTPAVPGGPDAAAAAPTPDLEAALALLKGRAFTVTMMGAPLAWECGQCQDFEVAITGQLKAIGVTVVVRHADDYPGDALDANSKIDLLDWGSWTSYHDPVALLGGVGDDPWIGKANARELERLQTLSGQARIDAAATFAHRIVDDEALVVPYGYSVYPFFVSQRIGCGFVQPAIGAVDLLSLCPKDGATESPAPSAAP